MKTILIFILLVPFSLFAQNIDISILKVGDVLLLPLRCQLCTAIMDESESAYSHSGVLFYWQGKWVVVEALGSVRQVSLSEFVKRSSHLAPIKILRLKSLAKKMSANANFEEIFNNQAENKFNEHFKGLSFDHQFLWDNTDSSGQQSYYCSEFVAKFLNSFSEVRPKIGPLPMTFKKHWNFWQTFFDGQIPEGEMGLSPGDLERSEQFISVNKPQ